jgi:hypothetical protein
MRGAHGGCVFVRLAVAFVLRSHKKLSFLQLPNGFVLKIL